MALPPKPPVFTLPLELRTKIYKELLSPDPGRVYTLYHDRNGRETCFNFDPAILRVCRQSHEEAIPLLYQNTFEVYLATTVVRQCGGGFYPDRLPSPPPLLRTDASSPAQIASQSDPSPSSSTSEGQEYLTECHSQLGNHGIIYLRCFQRLRHIRLVTARAAIWGQSMGGHFFTITGRQILNILDNLCCEATSAVHKSLEFIVNPDWRTKYGIFRVGRTDATDGRALEMMALLGKIRATRIVNIEEKVRSTPVKLERKQIDIDSFIESSTGRIPLSS